MSKAMTSPALEQPQIAPARRTFRDCSLARQPQSCMRRLVRRSGSRCIRTGAVGSPGSRWWRSLRSTRLGSEWMPSRSASIAALWLAVCSVRLLNAVSLSYARARRRQRPVTYQQ